jgi:hypothetical protein
MASFPPWGVSSLTFTARFMMTCSICPGSVWIQPVSGARAEIELDILTDQSAQHLLHILCELLQIEAYRLADLFAAESEQLLG